jgi:hypothetical protein
MLPCYRHSAKEKIYKILSEPMIENYFMSKKVLQCRGKKEKKWVCYGRKTYLVE